MCNIQLMNGRKPTEARNLSINALKSAGCVEHALPGISIIACHIIVCMVTCNDHQRTKDDFLITSFFDAFNNSIAGGCFRFTLNGTDEYIVVSQRLHLSLHLAVRYLCCVGSTVTHKYECNAVCLCFIQSLVSGCLNCFCGNSLCNSFFIFIDDSCIGTDIAQKGSGDLNRFKFILIRFYGFCQLIILSTIHQMGRLNHQILNTIFYRTVKRLLDVIDLFSVTSLHMIDNDLGGKGSSDRPVRIGFLQSVLNALDISNTAVIKRGSEADYEQFIFADFITVAGIIFRSIASIPSKIVRICKFAGNQFLLGIRQCIPGSFCGLTLFIRVFVSFLHIDCVNQLGHLISSSLIVRDWIGRRHLSYVVRCLAFLRTAADKRCCKAHRKQECYKFFHVLHFSFLH